MRPITKLEHLAEAAGCSIATVSRALANKGLVKASTRDRILEIARSHEFPLHRFVDVTPAANGVIVAVIPKPPGRPARLTDPFTQELLAYVGEAASEYQCDLQISYSSPETREELQEFLRRVRADGLIFVGSGLLHPFLEEASSTRSDFVVWGAKLEGQHYPVVGSDNFLGGFKAANHLLQIGRKHIHFLGDVTGPEMRLRFEGFANATGAEPSEQLPTFHSCELDMASAIATSQHIIDERTKIDGIVAVNDVVALGALIGLQRRGIRVPDDVAIVGYDDIELCRYTHPTLSTISQSAPIAGRMLVSRIFAKNKSRSVSELLTTDLIVRESSSFINPLVTG